jgi:hypothetical protein
VAFRLKQIEAKESDVMSAIVSMLKWEQARGRVIMFARHNSGGFRDRVGRWVWFMTYWLKPGEKLHKGYPDLSGMLDTGRAFYLEIKKQNGGVVTDEQQEFIDRAKIHGAAAGVVSSVDEARSVILGQETV